MADLTQAAKPRCLDLAGYEERYSHIQQFGLRTGSSLSHVKVSILADIKTVDAEPMISAEKADELKAFLSDKLAIVNGWIMESYRDARHRTTPGKRRRYPYRE